jgi:DNA helicase-2/ATP-dependent DNA helicase PcrA
VVNTPPRGIGETSQAQLIAAARESGLPMFELLLDADRRPRWTGAAAKGAQELVSLLTWLRTAPDRPVAALLQELVALTGFERHLETAYGPEGEDRIDNVRELIADANDFDATRGETGLQRFLEERALVQDADDGGDGPADAVRLMTLHSSKGLEFDAVFIAGLEEQRLPHRRAQTEFELEEERRLLYVGITRARRQLWLTHAGQRFAFGRSEPAVPSRFLHEIPCELLAGGEDAGSEAAPPASTVQVVLDDEEGGGDWQIGDFVEHDSFGGGRVIEVIGRGARGKVRVRFAAGEKTLHLAVARLRRIRLHEP